MKLRHKGRSGAITRKIIGIRIRFSLHDRIPVILSRRNHKQEYNKHPNTRHQGDVNRLAMSEVATDIKEFQLHEGDTGSADVQIARLTWRISELTEHLASHKKDFSSRRGLLMLVAQRRKLLDYLAKTDNERYLKILKALKLRR